MKTKLLKKLRKMYSVVYEDGHYILHSKTMSPYKCKTEKRIKDERRELILQHVHSLRHHH